MKLDFLLCFFILFFRYNEIENARKVFHRFVQLKPLPKNWLKWAKFEETASQIGKPPHPLLYFILASTL